MRTTEDRFWIKVLVHVDENKCYIWHGSLNNNGYGNFWVNGKACKAHRYSFFLHNGFYPKVVRHICDNPSCVNPKHLLAGDQADNMKDCSARGRTRCQKITHCTNGHEYTKENTFVYSRGERACRICTNKRTLDNYYKRKQLAVTR